MSGVEAPSGRVGTGVVIAVTSLATGVVLLVRLILAAAARRRRAAQERALAGSARALMLAESDTDVLAGLSIALATMLDRDGPGRVQLAELTAPDDPATPVRTTMRFPRAMLTPGGSKRARDRTVELTVPLSGPDPADPLRAVVFTGPANQLGDLTAMLAALGDQAGLALARIQRERQRRTADRERRDGLAHRASYDGLTGLPNAEFFREQLRADRIAAAHRDAMGAVLFVDLDDFTSVNDTYGHEIGDGVLVTVARRIRSALRTGDLAARLGGDEFAVLLRDVPDATAARSAAQRFADRLAPATTVGGVSLDIGASIGLAIASTPVDYDTLMRQADAARYTAKAAGTGRWRQYRQGMTSAVRRRSDVRAELAAAIRDGRLTLYYQPVVELSTGRTVGFEALIRNGSPRWSTSDPAGRGSGRPDGDADGGPEGIPARLPVAAAHLVHQAEKHGLIVQLGEWVLNRALSDAAVFNPPGASRSLFVGVNVSPTQLRQPGFVDTVRRELAASGVAPGILAIEITESLLVRNDERAWTYLSELRGDGVRVAIDDYGTGYASLSYLRQPGIDAVKIDRSFVQEVSSPRGRLLLESVVALTGKLGLVQIAEGIEDRTTRDRLVELGCRYGQGFFFAEPMPLPDAVAWSSPSPSVDPR